MNVHLKKKWKVYEKNVLNACCYSENVHHSEWHLHNLCNGTEFIPLGEILLTLDKGSWRAKPHSVFVQHVGA